MKITTAFRIPIIGIAPFLGALGTFVATTAAFGEAQVMYEVTHLEALGTSHRGGSINERGWVAGHSLTGEYIHATLWNGTEAKDLGTLAGPDANSHVIWDGLNNRGMVVGISQTADEEPLGENWSCSAFFPASTGTGRICLGFVWKDGEFTPLPAFTGGNNGFATGVNSSGQIVGWAENGIPDASCNAPQMLQFRAALWEVRPDGVQLTELPPLPGHETSAATAINERGNVVGISGACDNAVGRFSARNSVIWRNGEPTVIDDFGGVSWNTPMAINIHDEVVGFANLPDDQDGGFNARAFYWNEHDGITQLEPLSDNVFSQAHGINTLGVVVGTSFGGGAQRAFIWRKGDDGVTDLNTLVVPGYTGTLLDARDINDRGEISGSARDANGVVVTFIARPVQEDAAGFGD